MSFPEYDPFFRKDKEIFLGDLLKKLYALVDDADLALLHYYWGNHIQRGSLRITSIEMPESSALINLCETVGGDNGSHLNAFKHHIAKFGAKHSLLRWVYFTFLSQEIVKEALKPDKGIVDDLYFTVRFELAENNGNLLKLEEDGYNIVIQYSKKLIEALWPVEFHDHYSKSLYTQKVDDIYKEHFLICRGSALGQLSDIEIEIANELGIVFGQNRFDSLWSAKQFLAAFQSAIVYLSMALKEDDETIPNIDFYCNLGAPYAVQAGDTLPPMITFFTLGNKRTEVDVSEKILDQLKKNNDYIKGKVEIITKITPLETHFISDLARPKMYKSYPHEPKEEWQEGIEIIKNNFHFKDFNDWRKNIMAWLTSIICNLHNEIHEGQNLGFWFACGDLSEIEDSDEFILERAKREDLAAMRLPWFYKQGNPPDYKVMRNTSLPERLQQKIKEAENSAKHEAAKENYSWFQGSRYALFWDISFPEPSPVGLIRLANSNWEWYVENKQKDRINNNWPKLIVAFKRPDGTGGVLTDNKITLSLYDHIKRERIVENWISEIGESYRTQDGQGESKLVDEMILLSKLAVRIADNPQEGCCLVFLKHEPNTRFIKMGHEWKLSEPINITNNRTDDIYHLMPMDGATCIWYDDMNSSWEIAFRYLLQGDDNSEIITEIRNKINSRESCSLSGTGSRRWSGAISACRDDVDLVIVVSQDGDMYAFRTNEDNKLEISCSTKNDGTNDLSEWQSIFS